MKKVFLFVSIFCLGFLPRLEGAIEKEVSIKPKDFLNVLKKKEMKDMAIVVTRFDFQWNTKEEKRGFWVSLVAGGEGVPYFYYYFYSLKSGKIKEYKGKNAAKTFSTESSNILKPWNFKYDYTKSDTRCTLTVFPFDKLQKKITHDWLKKYKPMFWLKRKDGKKNIWSFFKKSDSKLVWGVHKKDKFGKLVFNKKKIIDFKEDYDAPAFDVCGPFGQADKPILVYTCVQNYDIEKYDAKNNGETFFLVYEHTAEGGHIKKFSLDAIIPGFSKETSIEKVFSFDSKLYVSTFKASGDFSGRHEPVSILELDLKKNKWTKAYIISPTFSFTHKTEYSSPVLLTENILLLLKDTLPKGKLKPWVRGWVFYDFKKNKEIPWETGIAELLKWSKKRKAEKPYFYYGYCK